MSQTQKPLFAGAIATSTTQYIPLPIYKRALGCTIGWTDATSAATITLELTDVPFEDATATDAGSAWQWIDSGEVITGPAATAAGGVLVEIENCNHRRARLKIVTTANSDFVIHDFGGQEY